jgi:hypothetical protein
VGFVLSFEGAKSRSFDFAWRKRARQTSLRMTFFIERTCGAPRWIGSRRAILAAADERMEIEDE